MVFKLHRNGAFQADVSERREQKSTSYLKWEAGDFSKHLTKMPEKPSLQIRCEAPKGQELNGEGGLVDGTGNGYGEWRRGPLY